MSHNIAGIDLTPPTTSILSRQFLLWLINNFSRIREFVTTAINGAMYFSTPTATVIAVAGTWVKLAGTTTIVDSPRGVSMSANNRWLATAHDEQHVEVKCVLTFDSSGNNQVIEFAIFKNGIVVPGSTTETKLKASGDVQQVTVLADIDIEVGDYLEIWTANETSTASVTVSYGQFHVTAHLH